MDRKMNPYEPPQPTDDAPAWLDGQQPRMLRWVLWLQVAAIVCTAAASVYDSGFYRPSYLSPWLRAVFYLAANAAPPMLLIGSLCWLVEVLRWWRDSNVAYWYLWLEPVIIMVGMFSMLPLVQ
jgi:hypothetical protein